MTSKNLKRIASTILSVAALSAAHMSSARTQVSGAGGTEGFTASAATLIDDSLHFAAQNESGSPAAGGVYSVGYGTVTCTMSGERSISDSAGSTSASAADGASPLSASRNGADSPIVAANSYGPNNRTQVAAFAADTAFTNPGSAWDDRSAIANSGASVGTGQSGHGAMAGDITSVSPRNTVDHAVVPGIAPVPEPGVFVTAFTFLSATGLAMVRGRRRQSKLAETAGLMES